MHRRIGPKALDLGQERMLRLLGRFRTTSTTPGARDPLTCAMPAPISPPPMTVTCLIRIFLAAAAAEEEEDMERTNCLVTNAMAQRSRGERADETAQEALTLGGGGRGGYVGGGA